MEGQLVINTGTTIITFLMVFLIQRAQNKDALAIHLKLNEIVAAMEGARTRFIELARTDDVLTTTHSIEEAASRHGTKYKRRAGK